MRAFATLLTLVLLAGCSEYLPISGGALEGPVVAGPDDWTSVAGASIIQLETRPEEPYSVNLWVLGRPGHMYIFAGDNRTEWVEHIAVNPNVRMQIDGNIYELVAEQVTDAGEFVGFADGWEEKYGNRPMNENVSETFLFRLTNRP